MTYRDNADAMQARIRTLEAELEAEQQRREAAEAGQRAAEAARDELRAMVGDAKANRRQRRGMWVFIAVAGLLAVCAVGWWRIQQQEAEHRRFEAQARATEHGLRSRLSALQQQIHQLETQRVASLLATQALAQRPGYLSIDSTPPAAVYLDGRRMGTTPLARVKIEPGNHHLKVQTAGCPTQERTINVKPGTSTKLSFNLKPRAEQ